MHPKMVDVIGVTIGRMVCERESTIGYNNNGAKDDPRYLGRNNLREIRYHFDLGVKSWVNFV